MGIFGKLFGKKKKEEAPKKPQTPMMPIMSLDRFALEASRSRRSIMIQLSQTAYLIDALKEALHREYPGLSSGEILSHAQGGLSLNCPNCGVLGDQAIPLLYLAGKGALQGAVYGGPNAVALGKGVCPGCGGSTVEATFDPSRIMTRQQAMRASALEAAREPELTSVCSGLGFQASLDVSPDESMICLVAPEAGNRGTVIAYEAGTANRLWSLPVPSAGSCRSMFVAADRVLILSEKSKGVTEMQLVNAKTGSVVAESQGPSVYFTSGAADTKTGLFVTESSYDTVLTVQTSGDRLELSTYKCGQVYEGPDIGPDGRCYVIVHYHLYRIEDKAMKDIMRGDNCTCFDPAGKVYCGGGYFDRSGESMLHIADMQTGSVKEIPYGTEPIDQIALAGSDRLLLANIVDERSAARYPNATVTLFSVPEAEKVWSLEVSDLKPWRRPLLLSVPEEDWALIQTGTLLKQISLQDRKTLRVVPNRSQDHVEARWLPSKRLLYVARNSMGPYRQRGPGTLECYRI